MRFKIVFKTLYFWDITDLNINIFLNLKDPSSKNLAYQTLYLDLEYPGTHIKVSHPFQLFSEYKMFYIYKTLDLSKLIRFSTLHHLKDFLLSCTVQQLSFIFNVSSKVDYSMHGAL